MIYPSGAHSSQNMKIRHDTLRLCFHRKQLWQRKKTVLMNDLGSKLGENMIACVDSDYDYLLQGATQTSTNIIESRYVFHTYAYAIENYQCYAEGLQEVCVLATLNDRHVIDFSAFMEEYSRLHILSLFGRYGFTRNHILNEFSMMTFCSFVRIDTVSIHHPEHALNVMSKKVINKLRELNITIRKHCKRLMI